MIATGFLWTDAIAQASAAYPDTHFLLSRRRPVEAPQRGQHRVCRKGGTFLVGVAAALLVREWTARSVGGVPTDLIKKFEAGYVAGASA